MCTTPNFNTQHLRLLLVAAFVLCAAVSGFAQSGAARMNRNGTDEANQIRNISATVIDAEGVSHPVGDLKVVPMGFLSPKEQEAALDHDLMVKMKETYGPIKAVEEFQKQKALRMQQEQPK